MAASHDTEEWAQIPEFPSYKASTLGRIKKITPSGEGRPSKNKDGCLSPWPNKKGYMTVELYENGKCHSRLVHCLVMFAFVGPKPDKYEIDHKDTDKTNNRLDNLEYVTSKTNMRRAFASAAKSGKIMRARGEDAARTVLTEEQARYVKAQLRLGVTVQDLADELGVSKSCIEHIKYGRSWKHI